MCCLVFPEIIFLASVAGMSMMCGFGATLAVAKKKDPNFFTKVCYTIREDVHRHQVGR